MSITTEGIEGEQKARTILKRLGFQIQQLDWIGKKDNQWIIFEIKERELYTPPPFLGTGLDIRQIFLREELRKDLGLRTILFTFIKGTSKIYYQYLDVLEKGQSYDTKNNIRIYPLASYKLFKHIL